MNRWIGRVALVTGASTGIGAGICRELVKQGMIVMGCARNVKKIEEMSKEAYMSSLHGKLHAWKCDMSRESEILEMHDELRSRFGLVDVCINSAITSIDSSLLSGKTSDWRYMLEVGIMGACINTREAVKLMREANVADGQIIQMGSIVAHKIPAFQKPPENVPTPWFHMYYGIKTMTKALTEGLRQELRANNSGIRVSTISPGAVETELLSRGTSPEMAEAFFKAYKCLQPEDVADAVTFILKSPPHVNVHDIILEPVEFQI